MSIETEFQSTIQNVQNAYNGLNNLGATIPQNKTIENIKSCLDEIYDRLPKTEFEEGESVTLENTLKGKLDFQDGKVGFGQASQETTQGYNLLDINTANITPENASFTRLDTGYNIVIYDNVVYPSQYGRLMIATNFIDSSKTYAFSCDITCSEAHTSGQLVLGWWGAQKTEQPVVTANTKTHIFGTYSEITTTMFSIASYKPNATIKVENFQIYEGSTDKAYEKYTGGYASPSPNWEQEVKCVAGRNKFKGTLYNGIINNSGDYVSNSTRITNSNNGSNSQVYLEKGTYTLSIKDLDYCSVLTKNASGTIVDNYAGTWNTLPFTFNVTSEAYVYISARKSSNIDISPSDYNIMLEEGSTTHPYLPYNTIQETIRGINYCNLSNSNPESTTNINISINDNSSLLFDSNGETVQDSKNIFDSFTLPKVATLPKGDYTFAIQFIGDCNVSVNTIASYLKASASVNSGTYAICTNVGTITNGTIYATRFTLTEEKDVYLQVFTNSQNKKFTNTQMRFMIYSGSYPTTTDIPTYEPYVTPRTYQFSLGNNKFYKIGDYADELLYDVDEDKVYKVNRIAKHVLTENDGWVYDGTTYNRIYNQSANFLNPPCKIPSSNDDTPNILCNYLMNYNATTFLADNSLNGITLSQNGTISARNTSKTTLEQYKSWLSEVKPVLYYVIGTQAQTQTEITDTTLKAQVKAWYYGQSLDGTTIIESNGDLPMIIKVRGLKGE